MRMTNNKKITTFFLQIIVIFLLIIPHSFVNATTDGEWCTNKPVHGKFTLSTHCGVHRLSGECLVNTVKHNTAICVYHQNTLEIEGKITDETEGNLPQIYRQDTTRPYRLFTVSGGAQLTLRRIALKNGNVTHSGTEGNHIGTGGAIYVRYSHLFLYDSVLSSNIAGGVGGGATYIGQKGHMMAYNTLFFKNAATNGDGLISGGYGGAYFCGGTATSCVLNASKLIGNIAKVKGGGFYCARATGCKIVAKSIVSQNIAPTNPGISCDRAALCSTDDTSYINSPYCMPGTIGGPLTPTILTEENQGTQPPNSGNGCKVCGKGTYSNTRNAKTCKDCDVGTFTNDIGDACTNITVQKHHHHGGNNANQPHELPQNAIVSELENPSHFWRNIVFIVGGLLCIFFMYKICLFIWLKCNGRLNPEMSSCKAFVYIILYGSNQDAHMLPKEDKGVAMRSIGGGIGGNQESLLYTSLENSEGDEL